jgi:hypothetical protein
MKTYRSAEEFHKDAVASLQIETLHFQGLDRGKAQYSGVWRGQEIFCEVSECDARDLCLAPKENLMNLVDNAYVYAIIADKFGNKQLLINF